MNHNGVAAENAIFTVGMEYFIFAHILVGHLKIVLGRWLTNGEKIHNGQLLIMNEFTKEELEKICQFFNIAIEDFNEPEETYALRDKIQGMIDNFECHHQWIKCFYGEASIPINLCALCNLREKR